MPHTRELLAILLVNLPPGLVYVEAISLIKGFDEIFHSKAGWPFKLFGSLGKSKRVERFMETYLQTSGKTGKTQTQDHREPARALGLEKTRALEQE